MTGARLPSGRLVSSTVHWDIDRPEHVHTLMLMLFGQFLDHDLTRTAITKLTTHPSGSVFIDHYLTRTAITKLTTHPSGSVFTRSRTHPYRHHQAHHSPVR